ncbi:MAG: hypothetical protein CFE21_10205 [Bacteroidetes bacterium B1(2017)]|nr:MAG: hypothetical protein CFE21_10205 [Bacteroidetes bacterium B1(2017)]
MAYILDIATAVPDHAIEENQLVDFYAKALESAGEKAIHKKLKLFNEKTKIQKRYSCIPDFGLSNFELFTSGDFKEGIEKRTEIFKKEIMPLATKAIDKLLLKTQVKPKEITHLITVSCTGIFAPGFEFMVSEHYGLQSTEKLGLNFLGCYAAIKALKHAYYIANADPKACVLIISAELCSLHFMPSVLDEDIIANLLFADGAAATFVCGKNNKHLKGKTSLKIDEIGSAYIPNTLDLMTWNITSVAFKMYLNKNIPNAIKENIYPVVTDFLDNSKPDYWAIHPGGIRILEAAKESLHLTTKNVEDSLSILRDYGNMSSPTILFVLERIFEKIKSKETLDATKIFSCAFGPGLTIEMLRLSASNSYPTN